MCCRECAVVLWGGLVLIGRVYSSDVGSYILFTVFYCFLVGLPAVIILSWLCFGLFYKSTRVNSNPTTYCNPTAQQTIICRPTHFLVISYKLPPPSRISLLFWRFYCGLPSTSPFWQQAQKHQHHSRNCSTEVLKIFRIQEDLQGFLLGMHRPRRFSGLFWIWRSAGTLSPLYCLLCPVLSFRLRLNTTPTTATGPHVHASRENSPRGGETGGTRSVV